MSERNTTRHAGCWAVLWTSEDSLDGKRQYLIGDALDPTKTALFKTKQAAAEFVKLNYGYIARRRDLRSEPHGWRVPRPVRVTVTIKLSPERT